MTRKQFAQHIREWRGMTSPRTLNVLLELLEEGVFLPDPEADADAKAEQTDPEKPDRTSRLADRAHTKLVELKDKPPEERTTRKIQKALGGVRWKNLKTALDLLVEEGRATMETEGQSETWAAVEKSS
jgi:hypothetical protein